MFHSAPPRLSARAAGSGEPEGSRAGRPLAPAGLRLKLLGGLVLHRRRLQIRTARVPEPGPRLLAELVGPVEAVAGVLLVVVPGLALPQAEPDTTGVAAGGGGRRHDGPHDGDQAVVDRLALRAGG